jgi:hypothetical protein
MTSIALNSRQLQRDSSGLRTACAACGQEDCPRNPLVLAEGGMLIHVSHVLDPDDGFYGAAFAETRPLAEIAADALLAGCGHGEPGDGDCWAESGRPCNAPGIHCARFDRAHRRGLISGPDMAVVRAAAGPGAGPGTVIPSAVLAGAAS